MNILLTGASGFIGTHIAAKLHRHNHLVIPVSRGNGYDFNRMTRIDDWLPHLKTVDTVINCVGIIVESADQTFSRLHVEAPVALFRACAKSGIKRVIQISALGADERAITPYQASKKSADDVLKSLPVEWFVLRPSLVYGAGGKSMALFEKLARLPLLPLIEGGKQLIQPVHIDDLTEAVLASLTASESNRTIDVVGACAVSFGDWLQMMRAEGGKRAATIIDVPYSAGLKLSEYFRHMVPLIHPDNLRMLQQGNHADVQPLKDLIGRMPLDVRTGWRIA